MDNTDIIKSKAEVMYFVPYQNATDVVTRIGLELENHDYIQSYSNNSLTNPEKLYTHTKYGIVAIFIGIYTDNWGSFLGRYSSIYVRYIDPYDILMSNKIHEIIMPYTIRIVANRFFTYNSINARKQIIALIEERRPQSYPIDRYTLAANFGLVSVYEATAYVFSRIVKIELLDLMTSPKLDRSEGMFLARVLNTFSGEKDIDAFIWKFLKL